MLELELLDATFGAIVRGLQLRDARRRDLAGAARGLAGARPADLPRPVPHPRGAGRLRPALRRAWSSPPSPSPTSTRTGPCTATPTTTGSRACAATRAGTTTAPTCPCRPRARCSPPRSCRAKGRRPAGPTCEPRTRRSTTRHATSSRASRPTTRSTYSQGRAGYLPSKKNDKGGYDGYGYHDGEPPLRPLVKVHPDTGRPNLVIGRHAYGIVGMDPEESERFLDRLADEACQPPRSYHHQWEVGDAVIWDNRRLMHRGTPFDMTQPRRMWHTRIAGERPSELATQLRLTARRPPRSDLADAVGLHVAVHCR